VPGLSTPRMMFTIPSGVLVPCCLESSLATFCQLADSIPLLSTTRETMADASASSNGAGTFGRSGTNIEVAALRGGRVVMREADGGWFRLERLKMDATATLERRHESFFLDETLCDGRPRREIRNPCARFQVSTTED